MKNEILILILLILSLFSVSCIYASDVNDALAVSEDTEAIEKVQSYEEELISEDSFADDKPIFGEGASSFTDLNYLINTQYSSNDTITLSTNYTFNAADDDSGFIDGIGISRAVTIDGQNHVLDGANRSRILLISHANVTLKNLVFVNGFADDGGAIHLKNSTLLISNCTFIHNRANVGGGALYAFTVKCKHCRILILI